MNVIMSYQALLFCPDDKTARTVTQVLSELEFNVEPCVETFAAVKKLMNTHFDAVVVDCDNEQNATLLFKSARNSTSNQSSLAVAVVEGQAGVAKAFRIGANLVLTKPINIEQAKGTLRVARGLLRKGEPAKTGAPTATPAAPATPVAQTPATKPVAAKPAAPPRPTAPPAQIPAWPAKSAVASTPVAPQASSGKNPVQEPVADNELPEISLDVEIPAPASTPAGHHPALHIPATTPPASRPSSLPPVPVSGKPAVKSAMPTFSSAFTSGGAASAPAPARETPSVQPAVPAVQVAAVAPATIQEPITAPEAQVEVEAPKSSASTAELPPPTFTFGGANEPESSGGSKKILLIAASIVIVAALCYAGFNYFEGRTTQSTSAPMAASAAKPVVPAQKTSTPNQPAAQPVAATSSPAPAASTLATTRNTPDSVETAENETPSPAKTSSKPSASPAASTPSKTAAVEEPAPLVVKGGAVPKTQPKTDAVDATAPSMIGIAAANPGASLPNLGTTASGPAPVLSSVHISQGVSQGLLVKKVTPIYPKTAMTMHIEGEVQLLATISRSGNISSLKVLKGDMRLAEAALQAVKQWKYKPYLLDGAPVEVQTTITLNFKSPN